MFQVSLLVSHVKYRENWRGLPRHHSNLKIQTYSNIQTLVYRHRADVSRESLVRHVRSREKTGEVSSDITVILKTQTPLLHMSLVSPDRTDAQSVTSIYALASREWRYPDLTIHLILVPSQTSNTQRSCVCF